MQGNNIYHNSYKELLRLNRNITSSDITIDFEKLDDETAGLIKQSLAQTISSRLSSLSSVIQRIE